MGFPWPEDRYDYNTWAVLRQKSRVFKWQTILSMLKRSPLRPYPGVTSGAFGFIPLVFRNPLPGCPNARHLASDLYPCASDGESAICVRYTGLRPGLGSNDPAPAWIAEVAGIHGGLCVER